MFFTVLCFGLVISLFKMAPKHSAEVLSSVPKCEKAVMCLMDVCVRHKLRSGCKAMGHEFDVSESTIYIKYGVFKETHIKQGYVLIG